jgi:hypothetical protein
MVNRRKFVLTLTAGVVAMGVVVTAVLADELIGVITKVDVEGKKITVLEKDSDKEVVVTITDETEQVSKKGNTKVDLEKLDGLVKKVQDAGKKGVSAKITHEKKVASKIQFQGKGGGKKKSE